MSIHLEHVTPKRWTRWLDRVLAQALAILRQTFMVLMIAYTLVCIFSFAVKLSVLTAAHGALDFTAINELLTDGLYVLIILAIVKSLFLRNPFDYAVTLLETGFVVLIRKLILLPTDPGEWRLLLVLGLTSSVFFVLILVIHGLKRRWHGQDHPRPASTGFSAAGPDINDVK
ncbi:hypothetical protein A9404_04460 [Halothiobacillus diazotrophicus]|uniref:Uncharacterized protein n=1 Tax=Halothiobacillus diazotrophicus TaxID=1860122 RepID=A0A191ZFT3_9GAMM|nr:hypothetical protein [Halothiobacillus diazotrophicus]ANJ66728.1 hypothetical protein A9404_04460 [Halothiobacillus diazotrophicus]